MYYGLSDFSMEVVRKSQAQKTKKKYFSVDMSPFWVLSQFPCKLYPVYTRKSTKGFHCHVKVTWFNDQRNWNWKNTLCCYMVSSIFHRKQYQGMYSFWIQRVLAICYFWDLKKFALAKNCITKIYILCTQ